MPLIVFEFQPMRQHVREARTVAVLAADRQFGKWRIGKLTVALREGIGTPAVTRDAAGQDRPIEPGVAELVSRRQLPALCLGVKRQRRLKYIIALPDKASEPVLSSSDNPLHGASVAEDFLSVGIELVLRLKELPVACINIEMQASVLVFDHLRLILRGRQGAQADELDGHLQLKTFSADRRWPPRWPQPELISDYISCS